jgi:hypothetical protein
MTVRTARAALSVASAAAIAVAAAAPPIRAAAPRPAAVPRSPTVVQPVSPTAAAPAGRSARNANYSIDVELDPSTRTLTGREVLTWRNTTGQAATDLRFHLYYNAWTNTESTWMRERARAARAGRGRRMPAPHDADWGWIDVTAVRLLAAAPTPFTDLTPTRRFVAPDDGNANDRTVMSVTLPRAVAPGETIAVELAWTSRVPRTFARTGVIGQFYFLAQWFPKVGVFEDAGWNAHQFHYGTEFFADYGVYDVRITVPAGWAVGATGVETARVESPNGKTMHQFVQEDVHDFAWTTSPDLIEQRRRFEQPGLPAVDMHLLLQPEHAAQAARHFSATEACLRDYGEWFGPYPYGHVTIVDPAWQSDAGGMEYPTLFTAGTRWLVRAGVTEPEGVTVHECGHQFWYGIVGNNEFEHAWMDEGLNTFSTARVIDRAFTPNFKSDRFFGGFVPWVYHDIPLSRETDGNRLPGYRPATESDVPATPSWRYFPATGGYITYNKTALWLHSLERIIGWPRLQRGMSNYFARWAFRHPAPRDFFAAIEEAAGRDLAWFVDETYYSANEVDYGVQQFSSAPARVSGLVERNGARTAVDDAPLAKPDVFVTELVVRRYGEAVLPVDVLVTFADGRQERERWDGRDRWRLYRWERPVRALTAQVDPGRTLLLDVNTTNNSWTLEPHTRRAARKWSAHWLVWLQDALLTWASLV